jgi:thiol-disulfide isomerase/thioredoxin
LSQQWDLGSILVTPANLIGQQQSCSPFRLTEQGWKPILKGNVIYPQNLAYPEREVFMTRMGFWIFALLSASLLLPGQTLALEKGEPAPSFAGTALDGSNFDLSRFKGSPVIIKVGTTWCGACDEQSKDLGKLTEFMNTNDIHYVEVFVQEQKAKVDKYLRKKDQSHPEVVLLDDGDIARKLNLFIIPRVILLDPEHRVYRDGEMISDTELQTLMQAMLDDH